ncbi:MAG TPA: ABC transporter ATP-binding protein [Pyrinomonadaceae bacterium]|nr:ABC transporter ATP-binding protein [Pyrinomonadaceae bacterium]
MKTPIIESLLTLNSKTAVPKTATVVVQNLCKNYGKIRAVDGISFEVRRGEVFGLLGRNGAGKTTTVEIIEGLRSRDEGVVTVCGYDPAADAREVKQRIGVALQATALPDKIEVREALRLFAGFYRRRTDVDELLAAFSLEDKATSRFETLSGGQQQRLAVALALVNDPEVIIMDEPTSGLDAQARREVHGQIERLKGLAKTVILTTHYIEEAEKLCDRVAIMDHGRIVAIDDPRVLVSQSRERARIEFRTDAQIQTSDLRRIPFVESIKERHGTYVLQSADAVRALVELIKWIEREGIELEDLHVTRPTLEDVFIELTGRKIPK